MTTKYEVKKFNENNFLLWKLKIKIILRKENYTYAIGERPMDITNERWN